MTRYFASALALSALSLASCASIYEQPDERIASATLQLANGTPVGTAHLLPRADGLALAVAVSNIDPGAHGFHLHQTGSCRAPDFSSAGPHLNPTNADHGWLDENGSHAGDLPNIEVGATRTGSATYYLDGNTDQLLDWIFDADGTAVVLHEGADDYRTDPSGASGARIACGVLVRNS